MNEVRRSGADGAGRSGDPAADMDFRDRTGRGPGGKDMQARREPAAGDAAPGSADRLLSERSMVFARALQREHDDGERRDDRPPEPLVVIERPPGPFGLFASPVTEPARTAAGDTTVAERAFALIENALAAEGRLAASAPVRIAIPLPAEGLTGILLTLTPDGVDVVLEREPGDLPSGLVEAARELAGRLQARLGRRQVRIFDAVAAGEGPRPTPRRPDGELET
ncbi:hypothetical protein [Chthonobacter rhizosphaerae]|uniref:hypothetical protein n=1 Tax=Chthonobacter rhizosphaerae TaxID=2735553 RepID=UPI0015EE6439|nr:hypothetical protein [Chthonobacter rhizosphaerae]